MLRRIMLMLAMTGVILVFTASSLSVPPVASAACNANTSGDVFYCACNQNKRATQSAVVCKGQDGTDPVTGPNGILSRARLLIAVVGGIAAVIIIVISGFKFVTADGDAGKIANARSTLLYALIGIAIIAIATGIISFVLGGVR